ncbi:hypothetical protein [Eggerthella sp. YY7918]|uniref:hypothetical protein n=1 Tax=Eggerthella sp. (strain YY7918) TaxID=502558 RepID=UPI00021712C7|nr:hypothetical protein [Eggerthella sp. YY7918]BAK44204.1 hypothetical protein EGYY_10220 [Eggerthella sp. YY7918]
MSEKQKKIDLTLLAAVLNPALFVILAGGLLLGYDTTTLIIIGVVGYSTWGVIRYLSCRQQNT